MRAKLPAHRIQAIDAFRGLTIFTMIFVNELAGVTGVPAWMKHASADDDAMTFVDVVFPAFLFIVGMSIPFSLQRKTATIESTFAKTYQILLRGLALVVMGVFMVNAEGGYNEKAMGMSIHLWSLLFYLAVVFTWIDYRSNRRFAYFLRALGVVLLVTLVFVYRDEGGGTMSPSWWGILGLIGWAYLAGTGLYLVSRGNRFVLIVLCLGCFAYYTLGHFAFRGNPFFNHSFFSQGGHAVHTAIVLAGVLLSLIFYQEDLLVTRAERVRRAIVLTVVMLITGLSLRPLMGISKIYATPSWAAFSIVICVGVFLMLYLIVEQWKVARWTILLKASAQNPLLVYIIPFIIYAAMQATGISFPGFLYQGATGIVWALCYSALVMLIGYLLLRMGIRLKL